MSGMDSRRRGNDDVAAVDSRCCGNDDCGVRRRRPSFPWRGEPIAGPPPWIPAIAGMTMWLPWIPAVVGTTIVGCAAAGSSFPWRREPIAGAPPWIRAVAGMTIVPWCAAAGSSFPWRREPIAGAPPWISRRPAGMTIVGCAAAARRSRGDGNPGLGVPRQECQPSPPRCLPQGELRKGLRSRE